MKDLNHALTEIDVLLPPKQYIKNIIQVTCDKLDCLFGTVIEINENGDANMIASYNLPENYPEMVNNVEASILSGPAGEAFETGQILVVHNPFSDPRIAPWKSMEIITGPIGTIIWVPLFKSGKIFGICAYHSENKKDMSGHDLSVLEQIGVMISIAITSNQYLDKLSKKANELEKEIVERKKAENQLQQLSGELEIKIDKRTSELSEANKKLQLFRDQIDQSNDAIFVIDPKSARILDTNMKGCTSLGYTREELLSMKIIDFEKDYQDIDSWIYLVDKIKKNDCQIIAEGVHKRKDGTTFPVDVDAKLVTQHKKDYLVAVIHDMTKRKQVEEKLRESEEKFRTLVTNTEEIVFIIAKDGTFILSEGKGLSRLGLKPGQVVGKSVFELYKDYPDMLDAIRKALNGETLAAEVNVGGIYFRSWYTPHKNNNGEIIGLLGLSINITECKQVEEALWVSNEKYRSLTDDVLNSSAVGIFILDSHLRVVWVNQALEDYFDLKKNEIIGKDKRQLIRERIKDIFEDPDSFANKVFNTYDDNTYIEHFECHVLPNDKRKERWLEHRSRPIQSGLYAGGRIEHYYDITERKQAEEKLKASEDKYSTLVEKGNDGIIIIQDFVLKFVNSKMIEFIGFTKEKVIGKPFSDYVSPEYKELVTENVKKRLKGEAIPSKYEIDIISKDDSIIPVEISASIIEYEGKPADMAIIRDITERKQAEKELMDTKNYLDMIISMSYDSIMVIDNQGKFEFANNACCEMSGYTKEEIINKPVLETIAPEYTEFMINKWNEVQAGENGTYETVMVKKDGTKKNLLISHSNVEINGQQKYVAVIKDITTDITEYINMIAETLKDQHED